MVESGGAEGASTRWLRKLYSTHLYSIHAAAILSVVFSRVSLSILRAPLALPSMSVLAYLLYISPPIPTPTPQLIHHTLWVVLAARHRACRIARNQYLYTTTYYPGSLLSFVGGAPWIRYPVSPYLSPLSRVLLTSIVRCIS